MRSSNGDDALAENVANKRSDAKFRTKRSVVAAAAKRKRENLTECDERTNRGLDKWTVRVRTPCGSRDREDQISRLKFIKQYYLFFTTRDNAICVSRDMERLDVDVL